MNASFLIKMASPKPWLGVWLCCMGLFAWGSAATSNATPSDELTQRPPGWSAALETQAQTLGGNLRCPVCQGMPIAESPSGMARAMMSQIRTKLHQGQSPRQIEDGFIEAYGAWVLLQPRFLGINRALWILPPLALLMAVVWWFFKFSPRSTAASPNTRDE